LVSSNPYSLKLKSRVVEEISRIKKLLHGECRNIAIITHVNPDGDAIGSCLALSRVLLSIGHKPGIITPNVYPDFLKWMPGNDQVIIFNNAQKTARQLIEAADIIFCIDFNDLSRIKGINELVGKSAALKVLIDHHPTENYFADVVYCDTNTSSTAELIFDFVQELGFEKVIDTDSATCIFAGIMTDTGCFSFNSSIPHTYKIVARLLECGIDKDMIYHKVYDNFSVDRMRLLGYVLYNKLEVFQEYRTALISLTRDEQKRYNFYPGDSEGFVNYPLSIKNIRFSVFFIEKEDHVKMSFRSKGLFAVNKFAELHFNGGGHINASGGEYRGKMDEAIQEFRELLARYHKELNDE
jgi:phosphoesterase RecJ-like protein